MTANNGEDVVMTVDNDEFDGSFHDLSALKPPSRPRSASRDGGMPTMSKKLHDSSTHTLATMECSESSWWSDSLNNFDQSPTTMTTTSHCHAQQQQGRVAATKSSSTTATFTSLLEAVTDLNLDENEYTSATTDEDDDDTDSMQETLQSYLQQEKEAFSTKGCDDWQAIRTLAPRPKLYRTPTPDPDGLYKEIRKAPRRYRKVPTGSSNNSGASNEYLETIRVPARRPTFYRTPTPDPDGLYKEIRKAPRRYRRVQRENGETREANHGSNTSNDSVTSDEPQGGNPEITADHLEDEIQAMIAATRPRIWSTDAGIVCVPARRPQLYRTPTPDTDDWYALAVMEESLYRQSPRRRQRRRYRQCHPHHVQATIVLQKWARQIILCRNENDNAKHSEVEKQEEQEQDLPCLCRNKSFEGIMGNFVQTAQPKRVRRRRREEEEPEALLLPNRTTGTVGSSRSFDENDFAAALGIPQP